MRKQARVLVAFGAALALGAGAAHADEKQKAETARRESAGMEAPKELSGRVVQAGPSKLFVEHMGAVVEFRLASDAQFSGAGIQGAADLEQGQEVRTSFVVENDTTNVAKRVTLAREAPGAAGQAPGQGAMPSGPQTVPGAPPPREPGTAPPQR